MGRISTQSANLTNLTYLDNSLFRTNQTDKDVKEQNPYQHEIHFSHFKTKFQMLLNQVN
jgi:hypothetical protein